MKPNPVRQLAELTTLTPAKSLDAFAELHIARTRAFAEQGKIVHLWDTGAIKMKVGQTVYGELRKRGMPEGSVGNARIAAAVIAGLVATELMPEATFDAKASFRVCRMAAKLLKAGKDAAEVADILKTAPDARVAFDELESHVEHGMGVAAKEAADIAAKKEAEEAAAAAAAATAAATAAAAPVETPAAETPAAPIGKPAETPAAPVVTPAETPAAPVETPSEPAAPAEAPAVETPTDPVETAEPDKTVPFTGGPKISAPAAKDGLPEILEIISRAQLASYDLNPGEAREVIRQIDAWREELVSNLKVLETTAA